MPPQSASKSERAWISDVQTGDLRVFVTVVEQASFSKAGAALGISQPTISVRLQNLEEQLGLRLIDRRKGVVLTDMGRTLYNHARHLLSQVERFQATARDLRELRRGSLRVGFSTPSHAMALLGRFRLAVPQIELNLIQSNTWALTDRLKDSEIDVAIMTMDDTPPEGLSYIRLAPQRMGAMVGVDHPLAQTGRTRWRDILAEPLIVRRPPSMTHSQIAKECKAQDLSLEPFLELPSREAVKEAVTAGLGVGLAFSSEIGFDSRLVPIEIVDATTVCGVYVVTLADMRGLPAVDALMEMASSLAELTV